MCAAEVTGGHEKLIHNLAAGENEGLLEEFRPFLLRERVVFIEPFLEGAMFLLQFEDPLRVDNGSIDLQPVADDAHILKEARAVLRFIARDFYDLETIIRFSEILRFLEDGDPRQARLVDLEDEALEKFVVVLQGKAVLCVVILFIEGVFGVGIAIVAVGGHRSISITGRMRIFMCQKQTHPRLIGVSDFVLSILLLLPLRHLLFSQEPWKVSPLLQNERR